MSNAQLSPIVKPRTTEYIVKLIIGINGINTVRTAISWSTMENQSLTHFPGYQYRHLYNPTSLISELSVALDFMNKMNITRDPWSLALHGGVALLGAAVYFSSDEEGKRQHAFNAKCILVDSSLAAKAEEFTKENKITFDTKSGTFKVYDNLENVDFIAKELILVAHSHGGMIVDEYLKQLEIQGLAKIKAFTFGSPVLISANPQTLRQYMCNQDTTSFDLFIRNLDPTKVSKDIIFFDSSEVEQKQRSDHDATLYMEYWANHL